MLTIQNADAALKDYYLDAVSAQLNDGVSPFFSKIEKATDYVTGKDVKLAVVKGNPGNVMAGAEDGSLPDPHKNRYLDITMPLKNIYGTIEISDKAMRASRETSGAFVNLLNAEMEGLVSSAKHNFSRMLFGDGTGKLFQVVDKVADNIYKTHNPRPYLVGMQVDFYTLSGELAAGGENVFIEKVDKVSSTVTLSTGFTENVIGGYVYVHGSKDKEITGLGAIFDSEELYGYNKLKDPYFAPYKVDGIKQLKEETLSDIIDHMEEYFNSKINFIVCSYASKKRIAELIDADRRVVNSIDAHTGFGTVTVNNIPVYADKYCPDDRILFLNTDDFALYQLCDWEWLEDEDGKILKQVPGKAAYSATLVKYAELICRRPYAQAMLFNFHI